MFICIILIYCCLFAYGQDQTGSPYFALSEKAEFPLVSTTAEVNIVGVIADVTVRQTYVNNGVNRLEATYVFPGSTNSAVYGMTMIVGSRRIEGLVQRKAEARATYEAAKAKGKRASLLEQHRPNVFQMNVANILPGDTVQVELRYTELLVPESGTYKFVYPTVVGPRYTGEDRPETESGGHYAAQSYTKNKPAYAFDINVRLNPGMPVSGIRSPSHSLAITSDGESRLIMLGEDLDRGNKDYVLEYQLQGEHIQTGMLLYELLPVHGATSGRAHQWGLPAPGVCLRCRRVRIDERLPLAGEQKITTGTDWSTASSGSLQCGPLCRSKQDLAGRIIECNRRHLPSWIRCGVGEALNC